MQELGTSDQNLGDGWFRAGLVAERNQEKGMHMERLYERHGVDLGAPGTVLESSRHLRRVTGCNDESDRRDAAVGHMDRPRDWTARRPVVPGCVRGEAR